MMNKKAIAAFAAGATLLAGFAMATPVFAADAQAPKKEAEKELTGLEKAQKALNEAKPAPAEADPKNSQDTKPAETSKDAKAKQGQSGQAGANGAAAGAKTAVVEKKKDAGKKLPATGVGVTLTALAATMLAGMGAAVRKARH